MILVLTYNLREGYNAQNSSAAGASPSYASLWSYGNYGPYGGAYNDFYKYNPAVSGILKRCSAGPYTYTSNSDVAALCSTIPQDALNKVGCDRVELLRYTAPAFGCCGSYDSQMYPGYKISGSPQLKYPVITDVINLV